MLSFRSSITSVALAVLLAGAGACAKKKATEQTGAGTGSGATPSGPVDPRAQAIITKSKELRDRACACADPACAATVRHDHDLWLQGQIDEFTKLGEPASTKAQQDEAGMLQRELFSCLSKQKATGPTTGMAPAGTGAGTAAGGTGTATPTPAPPTTP